MKNTFSSILLTIILAIPTAVSHGKATVRPQLDIERLEFYNFTQSSPLEDRIIKIPNAILKAYIQLDGNTTYRPYIPTASDKALLLAYLALLPPVYQSVFTQRCAGIYFIKNLMGNGITTQILDAAGKPYFHIVLNPASLKNNLSVTLSQRERSCYIFTGPEETVSVDAGTEYKGLAYALFHEASHGVDMVKDITPLENKRPPGTSASDKFFKQVWSTYWRPHKASDHALRDKITFYGLNGGPKIPVKYAAAVYKWLIGSPFASLYGSKSWGEDFAELATFNMITQELGQPYKIRVAARGAKPLVIEPMRSREVMSRVETIMGMLESF